MMVRGRRRLHQRCARRAALQLRNGGGGQSGDRPHCFVTTVSGVAVVVGCVQFASLRIHCRQVLFFAGGSASAAVAIAGVPLVKRGEGGGRQCHHCSGGAASCVCLPTRPLRGWALSCLPTATAVCYCRCIAVATAGGGGGHGGFGHTTRHIKVEPKSASWRSLLRSSAF